jgi:hypothetical protein
MRLPCRRRGGFVFEKAVIREKEKSPAKTGKGFSL